MTEPLQEQDKTVLVIGTEGPPVLSALECDERAPVLAGWKEAE